MNRSKDDDRERNKTTTIAHTQGHTIFVWNITLNPCYPHACATHSQIFYMIFQCIRDLNGFLQFLSFPHFKASFSYSCDSCFVRFVRLWNFFHPFNRSVCASVCTILFSSFLFIFIFWFSAFFFYFSNDDGKSSVLHKWKVKFTVIFRPFFPYTCMFFQLTMFECYFIIFKAKFCFSIEYFFLLFFKKRKEERKLEEHSNRTCSAVEVLWFEFPEILKLRNQNRMTKKKRENWIGSVWKFIPLLLFRITTFMTNVFDGIRSFLPAKILDFHYIFIPLLNLCLYFCTQKSSGMNF